MLSTCAMGGIYEDNDRKVDLSADGKTWEITGVNYLARKTTCDVVINKYNLL